MTNTLKNIRENIAASQMARLKKEYEPLRKIDMSKHKGQVEKTTAMLRKLQMGTLIDLSKKDIPWISDISKSLVLKDKRFAHHVEEVEEGFKSDAQRQDAVASLYRTLGLKGASKRSRDKAKEKDKKKEEVEESKLYLQKEYESSEFGYEAPRDMKNVIDAAKKAGAKIISQEKPSRSDPQASIEIETSNPSAVKSAINKADSEFTIDESLIVGLNKSSAEYKAGKEAAKKGIKYDANPHAPGVKRLNWSTGHNDFRADALRKAGKPNYGARGQFEEVQEADLTKTQIKMVHDKADELPKNDFIKRYGKDGDSVRYATATNIVKKKLGIEEETSPEVANVLKKYVTAHPLRFHGGPGLQGGKNKRDFIELQKLALSDMDKFRKKYNDMKAKSGEDNYNQQAVRDALAKAGLSKHLADENKIEGEEIMSESYKDKFNAQMKKAGIDSLDDLKTDAEKKAFFKAVDKSHTADHEEAYLPPVKYGVAKRSKTRTGLKNGDDIPEGGPGSGPQFSSATIKKAYGILNDPRYKQGNYSGAAKAIEKLGKGLSNHPDVKNAMKRANESIEEKSTEDKLKKWGPVKQLPPIKLPLKFGKPERVGVKSSYGEDHDCEHEHPGVSHESWKSKEKKESKKYFDTKPGSIQDTVTKMYED